MIAFSSNRTSPSIIGSAIPRKRKVEETIERAIDDNYSCIMASSVRSHTYGVGEHALQANGQLLPRLTRTTRFAFANRARVTVVCVRVPIKPITQLEQTRARDPGNRRHDTIFANQGSRFRPF